MKTSCFRLYQGPGRICVARYAPRGTPAGYRQFKALAPAADMLKMTDQAAYRARYFAEILGALDPAETWDALHALAGGAEPVLLCWEDLAKPDAWCHRRMIAEWFKDRLGHDVPELETGHGRGR